MLLPTKYEDVRRSPPMVGAFLIPLIRRDGDLNRIIDGATRKRGESTFSLSFTEVLAGLVFLYACGLITTSGSKVIIHAPH